MSIFSWLFGTQDKEDKLENANTPGHVQLVAFEKALNELINKDIYIAHSDYKPLCAEYHDLYNQFDTLKKSKTLKYYCSENHIAIGRVELFLVNYHDLMKDEGSEIFPNIIKLFCRDILHLKNSI